MRTVKTLLAISCLVALSISANAQWTLTGNTVTLTPTTANVGIGTTSPGAKLDVIGTTRTDLLLVNKPNTAANWNNLWQSGFYDSDNATNAPESSGWFWGINMGHRNNNSGYRFGGQIAIRNSETSPTMYFRSTNVNGSGTWAKVLHNVGNQTINGDLGIGTVNPEAHLHIRGGSGTVGVRMDLTDNPGGNNSPMIMWDARRGGANNFFTLRQTGNVLLFERYTGIPSIWDGRTELLGIHANGNIGIGLTNPGVKLDVNGTIRAHEVRVCIGQWCDYVFEDDYELMSLYDLSKFIKTNKHLPEIAPAVQVEAEGINLGEMNALLLKKIEELTLYVIGQNERMQILETEINKLKNK